MRALQLLCLVVGGVLIYTSPFGSGLHILGMICIGGSIVIGLVTKKKK